MPAFVMFRPQNLLGFVPQRNPILYSYSRFPHPRPMSDLRDSVTLAKTIFLRQFIGSVFLIAKKPECISFLTLRAKALSSSFNGQQLFLDRDQPQTRILPGSPKP
jgi:hypothetical protein